MLTHEELVLILSLIPLAAIMICAACIVRIGLDKIAVALYMLIQAQLPVEEKFKEEKGPA